MILAEGVAGIRIHWGLGSSAVGTWGCATFSRGHRHEELGEARWSLVAAGAVVGPQWLIYILSLWHFQESGDLPCRSGLLQHIRCAGQAWD